jgi:hypothetical protein
MTTIAQTARRTAHQWWPPLGEKRHLHAVSRRSHPEQPGAQGVLSAPDRQEKGAKACAGRLHAQGDHHPQHLDRAAPEDSTQGGARCAAPLRRSPPSAFRNSFEPLLTWLPPRNIKIQKAPDILRAPSDRPSVAPPLKAWRKVPFF